MKIYSCLLGAILFSAAAGDSVKSGIRALSPDYQDPSGRFEKLAVSGSTLRMGLKTAVFTQGGMLKTIRTGSRSLLAAPMNIEISADGKKSELKEEGTEVRMTGKNAMLSKGVQSFSGGKIVTEIRAAWDHTLECSVTIQPSGEFTADSCFLRFPMNLTQEKLLCGNDEPPNRRISGQEAAGKWVRKNITGTEPFVCSMWHNLWIGNTHGGLAWSFENLKDWHCTPGREMVFTPADNTLTIRLIDRKTVIRKPLHYNFFLNITPVAKMPKGWRGWRVGTRYNNLNPLPANKLIYWSFWRPGTRETHNSKWVFDPERLKQISAFDAAAGKARMFYFIPSHYTWSTIGEKDGEQYMLVDTELEKMTGKSLFTPDYSFPFKVPPQIKTVTELGEWKKLFGGNLPQTRRAGERVCRLTPELIERNLDVVNEFADKYNIPGIYSDGAAPKADFTPGIGLPDDQGKIRPSYAVGAYREMYKRIRSVVFGKDPKNGLMIAHNSAIRFFPSLVFFDFVLFGEDFFYWYQKPEKRDASPDGDFYYAHIWGDIDNLKTEFHRQYGMPQVLLPELRGANRKPFPSLTRGTRTMLCYSIQFDFLYWPLFCDAREVGKFDLIRSRFNTGGSDTEQVEFIPYWENARFTADAPEIKIGYYEKHAAHDPYMPEPKPQSFLLLISNPQFDPAEFQVKIPSDLVNVKVFDRQTNQALTPAGDRLKLRLDPYEFAILEVTADE